VMTLAKGLGNGVPIGACLARGAVASAFGPGNHGTTFGGNPLASAVANAVLGHIENENLLENVTERGAQLREFRRGQDEIPVWVRFRGAQDYGMEDLASFTVTAPDGRSVPLMAMVEVSSSPVASQIQRSNRQTSLPVVANLAPGATMQQARQAIEGALDRVAFPAGYGYSFGG
ncbi:aminotransferase class III-fold pyridoxal phosphate-dependent enzyme, partial [Bacillus tequilensis]|nr:aminotransferase class III-fold pyridoxal phosphate-dependent enzyme [Bacillus tequilensis]